MGSEGNVQTEKRTLKPYKVDSQTGHSKAGLTLCTFRDDFDSSLDRMTSRLRAAITGLDL